MREHRIGLIVALGVVVTVAGCGASPASGEHSAAGSDGGGGAAGSGAAPPGSAGLSGSAGGLFGTAGSGGAVSTGGPTGGGAGGNGGRLGSTGGTAGATGGAAGAAAGGAGVGGATGGKGGASGAGGSGASDAAGGGAGTCKLPATVSFQKDVQPFLSATCGGGNGCHVIDSASTTANGGYDHAYDWITAGAHPSSCPQTPTPKRFEIVMAVIAAAAPPTCSKSRLMPPQDETGAGLRTPLTSCQVATLQAWLDEPLVTQAHRVDDTDPTGTAPFPMPPFN
jgi:hypothetical protein